ncbi:MAG TPA: antibiotic biosynthesis monooxygenase [Polyangiaceae bacterium]
MLVVQVHVHVKPESVAEFLRATLENARASLTEPGVARFDVLQAQSDPTQFVLLEAYKTSEAPLAHKETAHYRSWRDTVADMMAEPRRSERYETLYPEEPRWQTPPSAL